MMTGCLNCNRGCDPETRVAICPHESGERQRDPLGPWPEKVDENSPLRMFIALRILRAWNNGTEGSSGIVAKTINDWIDGKMVGPVPWPNDPFFAEWAERAGFSKVGNSVGFQFKASLSRTA